MAKAYDPTRDKIVSKREHVTVWLNPEEDFNKDLQMFWCPFCRTPVVQYSHGKIEQVVAGSAPKVKDTVMLAVQCSNKGCKRVFNFMQVTTNA